MESRENVQRFGNQNMVRNLEEYHNLVDQWTNNKLLIGQEHLLIFKPPISRVNNQNIKYFCSLCHAENRDIIGKQFVSRHLSSYVHKFRYIKKKHPIEFERMSQLESINNQIKFIESLIKILNTQTRLSNIAELKPYEKIANFDLDKEYREYIELIKNESEPIFLKNESLLTEKDSEEMNKIHKSILDDVTRIKSEEARITNSFYSSLQENDDEFETKVYISNRISKETSQKPYNSIPSTAKGSIKTSTSSHEFNRLAQSVKESTDILPYSSQPISTNNQAKINSNNKQDESDTDYDTDTLLQESNPKKFYVKLTKKFTRSIDKNIKLTPKFLQIALKEINHLLTLNNEKYVEELTKIVSSMADDNSKTTSIQIKHEPMDL